MSHIQDPELKALGTRLAPFLNDKSPAGPRADLPMTEANYNEISDLKEKLWGLAHDRVLDDPADEFILHLCAIAAGVVEETMSRYWENHGVWQEPVPA